MYSILIVDDEISTRERIKNYLSAQEDLFDEVYCATDGEEAIQLLEVKKPQLIMTDINMPHMDGLELIEALKMQNREVTIIVLSGYDEFSFAQRAMRNGVEYYLLKPVDRRELVELMQSIKNDYFKRLQSKEEDKKKKERLQQQQQVLSNRLINAMFKGPIEKSEWEMELELLDLNKEDISYTICIILNEKAEMIPCKQMFLEKCEVFGLKVRILAEIEGECVTLVEIGTGDEKKKIEQWICESKSKKNVGSKLQWGVIVDRISDIYISYQAARKDVGILKVNMVERALKHIEKRWNDPQLALADIAEELHISQNYLRFLIKEGTGCSFVKYLTSLRLERAALMLEQTELKVQEIALKVGLDDAGYFSRIFTKEYGCSPSVYRNEK